jgi:glycosyltransferase involved in cell wall biosynthesis
VAHVVRSDAFAGVERYLTYAARGLVRVGWQVVVIGGDPERMRVALDGIPYRPAATTAQVARALLLARPFDLVHAHMSAAELAAALTAPVIRAPVVSTRHFAARRGSSPSGRLAGVALARTIRCQVAISHFVAGAIEGPAVVIPNGVPRAPAGAHLAPVVLMAQRLEQEKDVAVGIQAWAASGLAARGWQLVVAGGGTMAAELDALARALGTAGSVEFAGPQPDLHHFLDQAAIFLAPAPAEPFGLGVVEAMAAALPVVASAGGAHLETVGACSAEWLFPPGDYVACADRLRRLASAPERRVAYGRALQAVQRRSFDLEDHADRLKELYGRICGFRRSTG